MDTKFLLLEWDNGETAGLQPIMLNMSLVSNLKIVDQEINLLINKNEGLSLKYDMNPTDVGEIEFFPSIDDADALNPFPPTFASDTANEFITTVQQSSYTSSLFSFPDVFAYSLANLENLIKEKARRIEEAASDIKNEFEPLYEAVDKKEAEQLKSCEEAECSPEQTQAIKDSAQAAKDLIEAEQKAAIAKSTEEINAELMNYERVVPVLESVSVIDNS